MGQLSCSRAMIYKLAKEKKLELVKFGKRTRVTERSLNTLVDEMLTGDGVQPLAHDPLKWRNVEDNDQ